ncbi:transposase, IS605 OrfB family protein [Natrialba magadii ATCC 43099]|uniref:Transposase, IS605 OrfB family protein n=1 Tax=Natrialba magadii (strain ATCC 43099 / DSM 3394 / CCM 3739 / CIP 104546 / IAM 13178 / JCM 8861 / NBRC 102185 / NCIMB 2190 / MS3) TaxID=547559 RepID=L9V1Y4_NATMM|nr:zinc ribbon domain-containing protein [Natrialba magadii]ELY31225.1 transposase, IS605 OrfB family protein [Natrialba magadii ATCC 43099]
MSSTSLPATTFRDRPLEPTPVGVDVGVKNLVAVAPADGDLEAALVIEGDHVRKRHKILAEAMQALQGAKFDTTDGQTQLFAALWHQIRPQVYDAAVRVVRYAQELPAPTLVLEDLSFCEATLWERRTVDDVGTWLLSALQHAVALKAQEVRIPVTYVNPKYTTQQCHVCGDLGRLKNDTLECTTEDCSVDTVCRDRSAAVSIAQQVDLGETTEVIGHHD